MTKFTAIVLLGFWCFASSMTTRVEAQGVNLQFPGPLGNFKAQPNSQGSKGHYGAKSSYANSAAQKKARAISQQRAKNRAQEKQRALAAKHRAPSGATADAKKSATPAAPSIVIPPTPEAVTGGVKVGDAPVETIVAKDLPPDVETKNSGAASGADQKPVCRKYSAAVGSVIEVPCE